MHPLLSDAEIGDLLIRGKELVAWYKDLEEYATKALLDGKPIEGSLLPLAPEGAVVEVQVTMG